MIKMAKLSEVALVYANRYRINREDINKRLDDAEDKFFKGDYKTAYDIIMQAIALVNEKIKTKFEELANEQ